MRISTVISICSFLAASSLISTSEAGQRAYGGGRQRTNVIVTMKERPTPVHETISSQKFSSRGSRLRALQDGLQGHATRTQARVRDLLQKAGATTHSRSESFWLTNEVLVAGATPELVDQLSKLPEVESVVPEQILPLVTPVLETASTTTLASPTTTQWGVNMINTRSVWATGNRGQGVTVGIIDTGVRATHEAIRGNFRQSFGWFDPEKKAVTPYDATGHGTHVTGIIAGNNGIGVAPGVQWMMCKGCRSNGCYASDLLACFQFMLCPTTPDGVTKDCSKAPQVVNNSYGGGQGLTTFDSVIAAWRAAGIIPVMAAGNTGPRCGTVQSPGDHPSVLTVGATDASNLVASFSAKGPTVRGLRKPDVMAPGQAIRSSCYTGDNAYCSKSGTSMAAPHTTGAVALYLSARPGTTFDQIRQKFQSTALIPGSSGYTCGTTPDSTIPNNQFGFGRIDIFRALS
ncbi:hypothetical protein PINS_up000869 [Pythium insidiosum]|nr:hypothetical protein PINS_up000869 [Pythium insidiosum]